MQQKDNGIFTAIRTREARPHLTSAYPPTASFPLLLFPFGYFIGGRDCPEG